MKITIDGVVIEATEVRIHRDDLAVSVNEVELSITSTLVCTNEGIIFDIYDSDGENLGTFSKTYDDMVEMTRGALDWF